MIAQLIKATLLILTMMVFNTDAFAQQRNNGFTLEFNRSPENALAMLEKRGFSDVKILKRQMLALQVEACREGVRYRFKLRLDGQIYDDRRVGSCTKQLTEVEVRKIAEDGGFERISVVEVENGYRVRGCRENQRAEFIINRSGRVVNNRLLGPCERRVTFEEIANDLKERGYNRIKLVSDERRTYVIRACKKNREFQLQVSTNGRVESDRVTGRCRAAIRIAEIVPLIKKAGYDRVVVTDQDPPRYLAEGCREGRRYELEISRYGKISKPRIIGRCRPAMDGEKLTETLVGEGFYKIDVKNGRRARFLATACYAKRKYELDYSRNGDLTGEREVGKCRTMSPTEMVATVRARGGTKIETQIKACQDGRAVIHVLDRSGNLTFRTAPGGC